MRRSYLILLIAVCLVVFLGVSAILARVFSIDGAERAAITALVQAEARGDQAGMIKQLYHCGDPACRQRVAYDAARLRLPGGVSIILINPSAGFSLTGSTGTARVAWSAGNSLPVVQCVKVQRAGNALSGLRIRLLKIGKRIKSDTACPAKY
ncbi:MAG: hypothetical protein M3Z06_14310 [Actinomycetota bacterium]|nr:hypothetical protein [Actinomycetota bacterium]